MSPLSNSLPGEVDRCHNKKPLNNSQTSIKTHTAINPIFEVVTTSTKGYVIRGSKILHTKKSKRRTCSKGEFKCLNLIAKWNEILIWETFRPWRKSFLTRFISSVSKSSRAVFFFLGRARMGSRARTKFATGRRQDDYKNLILHDYRSSKVNVNPKWVSALNNQSRNTPQSIKTVPLISSKTQTQTRLQLLGAVRASLFYTCGENGADSLKEIK